MLSFLGGLTLLTRVHSWGLVVLVELLLATEAKEGVELVELVALVDAGARTGPLARASLWTQFDASLILSWPLEMQLSSTRYEVDPFRLYSLKISRRSNNLDCSLIDLVNEQASTMRLLA